MSHRKGEDAEDRMGIKMFTRTGQKKRDTPTYTWRKLLIRIWGGGVKHGACLGEERRCSRVGEAKSGEEKNRRLYRAGRDILSELRDCCMWNGGMYY